MNFNDREKIIQLTPLWKGERLPDGRPNHWNAGLWDDLRLLDGKPLIAFATSTPVQEELFGECKRFNKDTEMYNKAACEIVKKYCGSINDLYTLMNNYPVSYHSDQTHYYTREGTEVLTNAVVDSICEQLDIEAPKLNFDECYNRVDEFLGL